MYKFKFSGDTKEKFPPGVSMTILFAVYFLGAILATALITIIVGEDIKSICTDAVNCMAVNGFFNGAVFLLFPLLYITYLENKDFSYLSGEQARIEKQWYLVPFGFLLLLVLYPALLKISDVTRVFIDSPTYLSFEKNAFGGLFDGMAASFKFSEEYQSTVITEMISVEHPLEILLLFLVIAVIPGIAEEFFFRGLLQNMMMKIGANKHLAIWIIGFMFSAMHFSLTDFITRLLMGAFLGYIYFYSKNFWVPAFVHFLNNAFSVINARAVEAGDLATDIEKSGASLTLFHLVLSLVFCAVGLWFFKTISEKSLVRS